MITFYLLYTVYKLFWNRGCKLNMLMPWFNIIVFVVSYRASQSDQNTTGPVLFSPVSYHM